MLPPPSLWGCAVRGRGQSGAHRCTVLHESTLALRHLVRRGQTTVWLASAAVRDAACAHLHELNHKRSEGSPPARLKSTPPRFPANFSHYFIYQTLISLRRVREYFVEIVRCFRRVLRPNISSVNANSSNVVEIFVSECARAVWNNASAVVDVRVGGSSF